MLKSEKLKKKIAVMFKTMVTGLKNFWNMDIHLQLIEINLFNSALSIIYSCIKHFSKKKKQN